MKSVRLIVDGSALGNPGAGGWALTGFNRVDKTWLGSGTDFSWQRAQRRPSGRARSCGRQRRARSRANNCVNVEITTGA
jgi:hypothetical protein